MGERNVTAPFLSVYGHITVDHIMSVEEFPPNSVSVDVLSKDIFLGGTGTNIAVVASSLGVPTALCGFVGTDFPEELMNFITSKGVITDDLVARSDYCTAQAMIVNDSKKEQRVFFYQGPQGSASKLNNVLKNCASASKYVHFSTGDPDYYIDIMRQIKNGDRKIVFDPAQEIHRIWDRERFMTALGLSDIIFFNKYEAVSALKYTGASSLSQIGEKMTVCTEGADGSAMYQNDKLTRIPVVKALRTKDNTGAGDAYRAGFYAGKYYGHKDTDALILGAATASFVVEESGALTNIPSWDMVTERASEYLGGMR